MQKIIFKVRNRAPSALEIQVLRRVCGLSISDIQRSAREGRAVLEFEVFSGNWQEEKQKIKALLIGIEAGEIPLTVHEVSAPPGFEAEESAISAAEGRRLLSCLRQIELETQMATDLELGYISSPDEFEPHDDDVA